MVQEWMASDMEWIRVKDRLPEKNKLVLAYAASTARGGNSIFTGSYDNGFWFVQIAAGIFGLSSVGQFEVTHWMPLPEPPKEGE